MEWKKGICWICPACAVRFSLSHATTRAEIDETISVLGRVLEEMETTIRFLPCK